MAEFTPKSTIRQVLDLGPQGRQPLYDHGYDVGEGFQDLLSQHQSLLEASRTGRLRDLDRLLEKLNSTVTGSPRG